jgi:hypothetical protein
MLHGSMRSLSTLALFLLASSAHAGPRSGAAVAPATPAPALTPPSLTLTVTAPGPDVAWTLRVANTGVVPLKIIADARLLSFDVTPPATAVAEGAAARGKVRARAPKTVHCALPADMRPRTDDDRTLVIPPARAYTEKFDPRIFCFGGGAAAALVPGATVVAHLGWPVTVRRGSAPRLAPPFAVTPIDGLEPAVAAAKEIVAGPVEIGTPPAATRAEAAARPLSISTPAYLDTERSGDVSIGVTIANVSAATHSFLFRPETLVFEVTGPTGIGVTDPSPTVRCASDIDPGTSIREVFTTLTPRGRTSLGLLLKGFCPETTFDQAGLYLVRARLDTRVASGAEVGLRTFEGEVASDKVTALRVRREAMPFPSRRPTLE